MTSPVEKKQIPTVLWKKSQSFLGEKKHQFQVPTIDFILFFNFVILPHSLAYLERFSIK
jgi:hypothetical protein